MVALTPTAGPSPLHTAVVIFKRRLRGSRIAQIGVIGGIWLVGQAVAAFFHLSIPGGVIGMALLLAALLSGFLRPETVRRGARWYLAELLLFFVPAVLAVLDHPEFLGLLGLKILAVIFASILVVMASTALAVDFGLMMMHRIEARHVSR